MDKEWNKMKKIPAWNVKKAKSNSDVIRPAKQDGKNSSLLEFDGPPCRRTSHLQGTHRNTKNGLRSGETMSTCSLTTNLLFVFPFLSLFRFQHHLMVRGCPLSSMTALDDLEVLEFRLHIDIRILLFTNPSWRFDSFDVEFSSF